jgi:hypothetical protein
MDVPDTIIERLGSQGVNVFKQGHKAGKLEGAKVAKDEFATEMNSVVNGVITAKGKDGYKAPDTEELGKVVSQVFGYGKPLPDRNGVKRLITTALKVMDGQAKPAPTPKSKTPPTPKST